MFIESFTLNDNVSKQQIEHLYDGLNPDKRKRFPGYPLLKCPPVQQAVGRGRGRPRKTELVTTERRVVDGQHTALYRILTQPHL